MACWAAGAARTRSGAHRQQGTEAEVAPVAGSPHGGGVADAMLVAVEQR